MISLNWGSDLKRKLLELGACVLLCEMVGFFSASVSMASMTDFYSSINKPAFAPPSWLFAPVWLALYALMGAAFYLLWRSRKADKVWAFTAFGVQLFLNFLWSPIFFGNRMFGAAFAELVLLWFAIAATMVFSWRISKGAVVLLIPYIVWVTIAGALNFNVWVLN